MTTFKRFLYSYSSFKVLMWVCRTYYTVILTGISNKCIWHNIEIIVLDVFSTSLIVRPAVRSVFLNTLLNSFIRVKSTECTLWISLLDELLFLFILSMFLSGLFKKYFVFVDLNCLYYLFECFECSFRAIVHCVSIVPYLTGNLDLSLVVFGVLLAFLQLT